MEMNDFPSEFQCLLQALKWDLSLPYSTDSFYQHIDWSSLFNLARVHRIRTVLYEFITQHKLEEQIPAPMWNVFQQACMSCTLLNMELQRNYDKTTMLFSENDIQFLPLKGMALIETTGMPINRREFGDIDLLIYENKRIKARKKLYEAGYLNFAGLTEEEELAYTRHNTQMAYGLEHHGEASPILDLHWALGHPNAGFEISLEELLPFCKKAANEKILLNGTGLAITICAHHGGKDAWRHLRYLQDMGRLLLLDGSDRVKWYDTYLFLKTKDLQYTLLPTILSAVHLLGIDIPNEIKPLMDEKTNKLSALINRQLCHGRPEYSLLSKHKILFNLLIHSPSVIRKILIARIIHFFRPNYRDKRWFSLPDWLHFLYIVIRPIRLISQYFNPR